MRGKNEIHYKPKGAYSYTPKEGKVTSCGHYINKKKMLKFAEEHKDELSEFTMTFKDRQGVWKKMDCLTGEIINYGENDLNIGEEEK